MNVLLLSVLLSQVPTTKCVFFDNRVEFTSPHAADKEEEVWFDYTKELDCIVGGPMIMKMPVKRWDTPDFTDNDDRPVSKAQRQMGKITVNYLGHSVKVLIPKDRFTDSFKLIIHPATRKWEVERMIKTIEREDSK